MVGKKVEVRKFASCMLKSSQEFHIHQSLTAYPIAVGQMKVVIGNTQIEVKGGLLKR